MFFKNWPYWLKGGIIGFIAIFFISFSMLSGVMGIPRYVDLQSVYTYLLIFLSSLLGFIGFIIGVGLGLIYGKIKNRITK